MQENNSKFLEAINRAALRHCEQVQEEVKKQSREELNKEEKKVHDEYHDLMVKKIQKIKNETEKSLAAYNAEKTNALFLRRDEMKKEVFKKAQDEILGFTSSDNYVKALEKSAEEMKKYFNSDDIVVYIRKEDMKHADAIKAVFGKCEICEDTANTLGGIKAKSEKSRLFIDDTFATRLASQEKWFNEHSNLKID